MSGRWLVVGARGMLGRDVEAALQRAGAQVTAVDRVQVDITHSAACRQAVVGHDVVVNCAGYTAVDAAEQDEASAFAVNALGAANLARACSEAGAWLVHVSTDYVFAGDAQVPYAEDAVLGPRSAYGRSKAAGEWAVRAHLPQRHHLVRTAWLYGGAGPSFVHTMTGLALGSDEPVRVVDDQHGQPTWTADVADRIVRLVQAKAPAGTFHATSSGRTTWFALARAVFDQLGAGPDRVRPVPSSAYPRPAPRPAWSVLGHDRWAGTGIEPIGDWRERLTTYVGELRGGVG